LDIILSFESLIDKSYDGKNILLFKEEELIILEHFPRFSHVDLIFACGFGLFQGVLEEQILPDLLVPLDN
jgi:hypothetical protein